MGWIVLKVNPTFFISPITTSNLSLYFKSISSMRSNPSWAILLFLFLPSMYSTYYPIFWPTKMLLTPSVTFLTSLRKVSVWEVRELVEEVELRRYAFFYLRLSSKSASSRSFSCCTAAKRASANTSIFSASFFFFKLISASILVSNPFMFSLFFRSYSCCRISRHCSARVPKERANWS